MFGRKKTAPKPKKEPEVAIEATPELPEATSEVVSETIAEPPVLEQHSKPDVRILYEKTSALFANRFIANAGGGQIILDFSTGLISDHGSGSHILPIQERVAMTPQTAQNLITTLHQILSPPSSETE
tara:strand:+ start:12603 stop:12983 length:381 start_codon:yes stop_codon:yes gene_type:complete